MCRKKKRGTRARKILFVSRDRIRTHVCFQACQKRTHFDQKETLGILRQTWKQSVSIAEGPSEESIGVFGYDSVLWKRTKYCQKVYCFLQIHAFLFKDPHNEWWPHDSLRYAPGTTCSLSSHWIHLVSTRTPATGVVNWCPRDPWEDCRRRQCHFPPVNHMCLLGNLAHSFLTKDTSNQLRTGRFVYWHLDSHPLRIVLNNWTYFPLVRQLYNAPNNGCNDYFMKCRKQLL